MIKGFDNREGKIWFNGKLVEWNDSKTHVLIHDLVHVFLNRSTQLTFH